MVEDLVDPISQLPDILIQMVRTPLLFDIDRTIFDTDRMSKTFNELTLKVLNTKSISFLNKVKEKYLTTLKRDREFIPEDYFSLVCSECKFNNIKRLLDIFYAPKYAYIYKENVFKEAIKVFKILKDKYKLGIYSEGTARFQNHKFDSLGLNKYFDRDLIFIVDAKDNKETLERLPKESIIVDDKEIICEFLIKNSFRAIWLNRKDDRKLKKFETIYSLLELPAIL